MIIVLLTAWVLAGFLLALLVGGAVRIADRHYRLTAAVTPTAAVELTGGRASSAA